MRSTLAFVSLVLLMSCKTANTSQVKSEGADKVETYRQGLYSLKDIPKGMGISEEQMNNRISTCWKNPIANGLSVPQKTFYCYFPLEFRLCNSVVLLMTKAETKENYEKKIAGYQECKKTTGFTQLLGSKDIDAVYKDLYLDKGASISEKEQETLVEEFSPTLSSKPFPFLLLSVQKELAARKFGGYAKQIKEKITNFLDGDKASFVEADDPF